MKKYKVIVSPEAEAGIISAFGYIFERSAQSARRWLRDIYLRIDTLESVPGRCAPARERLKILPEP